ncbi:retrovirus-related pol polyprotein from transposon TNT 1-94 [Tanacetum coccineum]
MRVASVNGKKYILVIVDDYSRFTWVKFLRSKDKAPNFIIKFLKMIQVRLKVSVRRIRTDNGTEFVNQTLREYYEKIGISHETSRELGRIIETIHVDFDELTAMAFEHSSLGPALHEMTPATISSRLVPTPPPSTRFVDHPAPKVIAPIAEVVALVLVVSTGSPSSTTVDQDAPSLIAHMGNDPYFGVPIPEIPSGQSSLSNSIHTIVHPDHKISEHNSK